MAGIFGFFDYNKPGPGVAKNGPKKKGFVIFFEIFSRKFWKLIEANLLFVLISIPLLTVGLANVGLTYITRNFAREKHAFVAGDFFDRIKLNWKQALPVGIINLFLTGIIAFSFFSYASNKGIFNYIGIIVMFTIAIIFTFMKYYIYMLMITFKLSIKQLYKNSIIFALAGLKRNLLISIILIPLYAIGVFLFYSGNPIAILIVICIFLFIFPAFRSLLIQYMIFPVVKKHMIDPYYKEHPEEDADAKRALNIFDDEEEDTEERVFEDVGVTEDSKPESTIPRQYTEKEMSRIRRKQRYIDNSDDDGTI